MVCNNYNGKGYSKIILDWVKEFGSKNNKHYIRLDYESSRFGLKNLYTRNGFIEIQKWIDEGIEITKAEYRIN